MNYLKEEIQKRIKSVESKRISYRKKSYNIFMLTALLSGFITIILGLKITAFEETVRITALIISSVLTIINAYSAFYNNKELWIANNMARNNLYKLQFDIEFAENEQIPLTSELKEQFKNQYQQILDELNATWQKSRVGK